MTALFNWFIALGSFTIDFIISVMIIPVVYLIAYAWSENNRLSWVVAILAYAVFISIAWWG